MKTDDQTKSDAIQEAQMTEQVIPLSPQQMQNINITDPSEVVSIAKEINKYVDTNSLSVKIQGKQYVMVEGWQFTASLLGLVGMIEEYKNESSYDEVTFKWVKKYGQNTVNKEHKTQKYKYFAKAVFKNTMTDKIVGQGFAMCSNEEQEKHTFDEYSILSMAQTRAIGKAARMAFSFIIKAAGYEPTPAEEMDEQKEPKDDTSLPKEVIEEIKAFDGTKGKTKEDLTFWATSEKTEQYHSNVQFKTLVNAKYVQLKKDEPKDAQEVKEKKK